MLNTNWFQISTVAEKVFLIREPEQVQCYLLCGQTSSVLVDTGLGFCDLRPIVEALAGNAITVLNTHWHFDHIGSNARFERIGISALEQEKIRGGVSNQALQELCLRPSQQAGLPFPPGFQPEAYHIIGSTPTFCLAEGDCLDLGDRNLEVLATPGHTHGSLSFLDHRTRSLFCGDLVYDGLLYAHFDDSDLGEYRATLQKLLARRAEFDTLFPAHNTAPLPTSFLERVLAGIEAIIAGQPPARISQEWGAPVPVYEFDGFGLLAKMPGDAGIILRR